MKKILFSIAILISTLAAKAQLISDFEAWHNYTSGALSLTIPNGWSATDSIIGYLGALTNQGGAFVAQVSKEMPGNAGSATALRVTTKNQDDLPTIIAAGPMPCIASNSQINVDIGTGQFTFEGGMPCGYNPSYATMSVMNGPVAGDSTQITILALDNSDGEDSLVCIADTVLGASINSFTQITLPFKNYNPNFSTTQVRVIVSSSANFFIDATPAFTNLSNGTWLVVDDISISAPNGTSQYILSQKKAMVYPTVMENELHVNLQANDKEKYLLSICDMNGRKIKTVEIENILNTISVSELAKGNYIYNLYSGKQIVQSGKLTK